MSGTAAGIARRNARYQLLATLLNTMASASYTVGIAAPVAAGLFYGQSIPLRAIEIGVMVWAGVVLALLSHRWPQAIQSTG